MTRPCFIPTPGKLPFAAPDRPIKESGRTVPSDSGKYLGVSDSGWGNKFVLENDKVPFLSQKWYVVGADAGVYLIPLCLSNNSVLGVDEVRPVNQGLIRVLNMKRSEMRRFTLSSVESTGQQNTLKYSTKREINGIFPYVIVPHAAQNYAVGVATENQHQSATLMKKDTANKLQCWHFIYLDKGLYTIENAQSCMRLHYDKNNGNVTQVVGGMTPSDADKWYYAEADGAAYLIPYTDTGKALDFNEGAFSEGASVNVKSQNRGASQRLHVFVASGNGMNSHMTLPSSKTLKNDTYRITMNKGSKEYALTSSQNGGEITLSTYVKGNKYQQWQFKYKESGQYTIQNVGTKLYLDVNGSYYDEITSSKSDTNRFNQRWYPVEPSYGYYYCLVPRLKRWRSLAVPGDSYDAGTTARLQDQVASGSIPAAQRLVITSIDEADKEDDSPAGTLSPGDTANWNLFIKIPDYSGNTDNATIESDPDKDPTMTLDEAQSTSFWKSIFDTIFKKDKNSQGTNSLQLEMGPTSSSGYTGPNAVLTVLGAPLDSSGQSQATATVTNRVTNEENTYFVGDTVIGDGDTADIALTDCDTGETVTVTVPVYRISAQITYDANGGQGAPAAQEKILGVDLMISEQEPEREGYRFTGWGTDPNGEPVFQCGDWYAEDADMALYALWEPENLGGHVVADIEQVTVSGTKVSVTGWAFDSTSPEARLMLYMEYGDAGFSHTFYNDIQRDDVNAAYGISGNHGFEETSGIAFDPDRTLSGAQRVRIYAFPADGGEQQLLYEGMHDFGTKYSVAYDAAGGSGAPGRQLEALGTPLTLSDAAPGRIGFSFAGWALDVGADEADFQPGDTYDLNASATLHALWNAEGADAGFIGSMDVVRADNGALYVYGMVRDAEDSDDAPQIAVASGDTVIDSFDAGSHPIGATTGLTLDYLMYGFENTLDLGLTGSQSLKIYAASEDGKRYALMYEGTLAFGDGYTVAYDANGGEGEPASQTKGKGQALTLSSVAPTRAGYTFVGWSEGKPRGGVYASGGSWTKDNDVILQAVWRKDIIDFELPTSLQDIGPEAFFGSALSSVQVPDGCESIGSRAFAYSGLEEVIVPDSVTAIAGNAFIGTKDVLFVTNNAMVQTWAEEHGYGWIYLPGTLVLDM